MFDLAYVGHQGIVKTKTLIRKRVWYPGINKKVKEIVQKYQESQAILTISLLSLCVHQKRQRDLAKGVLRLFWSNERRLILVLELM